MSDENKHPSLLDPDFEPSDEQLQVLTRAALVEVSKRAVAARGAASAFNDYDTLTLSELDGLIAQLSKIADKKRQEERRELKEKMTELAKASGYGLSDIIGVPSKSASSPTGNRETANDILRDQAYDQQRDSATAAQRKSNDG